MPSFLRRASRCLVLFLLIGTYADAATIHWNLDSLVQIEGPSGYGRIIRLQDDSLLAAYSRGLKTWVKKSADDGRTWGDRIVAGEAPRAEGVRVQELFGVYPVRVTGIRPPEGHPGTITGRLFECEIDLPGLELLGDRQMAFLAEWGEDWTGAVIKAALSQTAFCGAVHLHGSKQNRLLADLDCNGWPQAGRNKALAALRRVRACHLCGDQHLAAVVKHGIDRFRDGPYGFTSPAIINSYYARWWSPADEQAGANPIPGSPLPWTGDYLDGLYNPITMIAYANPAFDSMPEMRKSQRDPKAILGDGYGLIRFNKRTGETTFECWPRYADVSQGDIAQYPGWPVTFQVEENDGRQVAGHLPELVFENAVDPVVQTIEEATGEVLYTLRIQGDRFRPHVYAPGKYSVKAGPHRPGAWSMQHVEPAGPGAAPLQVRF